MKSPEKAISGDLEMPAVLKSGTEFIELNATQPAKVSRGQEIAKNSMLLPRLVSQCDSPRKRNPTIAQQP
jgi:hypothetical protein